MWQLNIPPFSDGRYSLFRPKWVLTAEIISFGDKLISFGTFWWTGRYTGTVRNWDLPFGGLLVSAERQKSLSMVYYPQPNILQGCSEWRGAIGRGNAKCEQPNDFLSLGISLFVQEKLSRLLREGGRQGGFTLFWRWFLWVDSYTHLIMLPRVTSLVSHFGWFARRIQCKRSKWLTSDMSKSAEYWGQLEAEEKIKSV